MFGPKSGPGKPLLFLISQPNVCFGYSNELSQCDDGSFEQQRMLKLMDEKMF